MRHQSAEAGPFHAPAEEVAELTLQDSENDNDNNTDESGIAAVTSSPTANRFGSVVREDRSLTGVFPPESPTPEIPANSAFVGETSGKRRKCRFNAVKLRFHF